LGEGRGRLAKLATRFTKSPPIPRVRRPLARVPLRLHSVTEKAIQHEALSNLVVVHKTKVNNEDVACSSCNIPTATVRLDKGIETRIASKQGARFGTLEEKA